MQMAFGFGAVEDIAWVRDQLRARFGEVGPMHVRTPIGQLVKSSISGRTRDEISLAAYQRLIETYPEWSEVTDAAIADIEHAIGEVTFPDVKARHLRDALRAIAACRPDFDLTFLGRLSVAEAMVWLERLPGVGRKVSASTLNFSTLHMPALVVDTHILRTLRRFGFVGSKADARSAHDTMMALLHDWSAADLAELHMLMKCLGQHICCADQAHCGVCPISRRCQVFAARSRNPAVGGEWINSAPSLPDFPFNRGP